MVPPKGRAAETTNPKGAIIKACTCVNAYQDKKYGKGQRVMSATQKGARCSVCGRDS